MKKIIALLLLAAPATALADYLDVIEFKLKDGCSLEAHQAIVADFNGWASAHGYKAEVMVPLHRADLTTMFWIGRTKNAEAFGAAVDAWRAGMSDASSAPAKLSARIRACRENVNRSSFDVLK